MRPIDTQSGFHLGSPTRNPRGTPIRRLPKGRPIKQRLLANHRQSQESTLGSTRQDHQLSGFHRGVDPRLRQPMIRRLRTQVPVEYFPPVWVSSPVRTRSGAWGKTRSYWKQGDCVPPAGGGGERDIREDEFYFLVYSGKRIAPVSRSSPKWGISTPLVCADQEADRGPDERSSEGRDDKNRGWSGRRSLFVNQP